MRSILSSMWWRLFVRLASVERLQLERKRLIARAYTVRDENSGFALTLAMAGVYGEVVDCERELERRGAGHGL